jgi:hypothetical protein
MALTYCSGPFEVRNTRPASAFSKGDVVQYDSASSLSYADPLLGTSFYGGVALSSSTESYRDLVPWVLAHPNTEFYVTIATGSAVSEGYEYDLVPVTGDWEIATSSTTPRVVVTHDQTRADIQQRNSESADSWVIVKFLASAESGKVNVGTIYG